MKTWKLVSGIISIVLSVFVVFQSMIAGLANALEESGQVSGSAGLVVSICRLCTCRKLFRPIFGQHGA